MKTLYALTILIAGTLSAFAQTTSAPPQSPPQVGDLGGQPHPSHNATHSPPTQSPPSIGGI